MCTPVCHEANGFSDIGVGSADRVGSPRCVPARAAPHPISLVMATISVVAPFTPAVRVGRHATRASVSLVAGHRFPRDVILLAVRYYLQLGAAAERIAGVLADRGVDVSGRTILRWVQKFGLALAKKFDVIASRLARRGSWTRRTSRSKARGTTCIAYRGVNQDGQVLDSWLSRTRDMAAAEAFLRRGMSRPSARPNT